MTERIEHVQEVSPDGRTARTVETVDSPAADRRDRTDGQSTAVRVVWFIVGVLLALLAGRFLLALLGANRDNGFADFIFNVSHPFVAPFFSLFSYNTTYGSSHLELFTLVAMAVYALVGYGIVKLLTINRAR